MMNRPIDGVVVAAKPAFHAFGFVLVRGVVIRKNDGSELKVGRLLVARSLASSLEVGSTGCFYLHDILGLQGLHAFADTCARAPRIDFPMAAERACAAVVLVALAIVAGAIFAGGTLQLAPVALVFSGTAGWATFRASRQAVLHDLAYEARLAGPNRLVPAMARS